MSKVPVTVYTITGRQMFIPVPKRICDECDLTVALVRRAIEEEGLGDRVEVVVKPWMNNVFRALAVGGWHPPVVVGGGRVFNQGTVPALGRLRAFLRGLAPGRAPG